MDEVLGLLLDAVILFESDCDVVGSDEWVWCKRATEYLQSWGEFPSNTASSPTAPCASVGDDPDDSRRGGLCGDGFTATARGVARVSTR